MPAFFSYRLLFSLFAFLLVIYIILKNFALFGASLSLSSRTDKHLSDLMPVNSVRVEEDNGDKLTRLIGDTISFSTPMRPHYNKAKVRLTFKNPSPQQRIYLGYQNNTNSYNRQLLDAPLLNELYWQSVGVRPFLYQRILKYPSVEEFLASPPTNSVIGVYDLDNNFFKISRLENYSPSKEITTIETNIRGSYTFYVYLESEPFQLSILKQDINAYEDIDQMTVQIYKDKEVVYSASLADDGILDSSRTVVSPKETEIKNPGPDLPESGVYKVVVTANGDTITKAIKTTLSKIVFESPLFLVSNADIYPKIIEATKENVLYTNSPTVSALTYHSQALQEIKVISYDPSLTEIQATQSASVLDTISNIDRAEASSAGIIALNAVNVEATASSDGDFVQVSVPKSDVILKARFGNFSFLPQQFFEPYPFKLLAINSLADLSLVDYLMTNYKPSAKVGEWQTADAEFFIGDAVETNGRLNWTISLPNLKERGEEVILKDIEIHLTRDPQINLPFIPNWLRELL